MTPASCAPLEKPPPFKIAVPESCRAARWLHGPRQSLASPGSLPCPSLPCTPRPLRHTFLQPCFHPTRWDGTEQASGTGNPAQTTAREPAEPRAPRSAIRTRAAWEAAPGSPACGLQGGLERLGPPIPHSNLGVWKPSRAACSALGSGGWGLESEFKGRRALQLVFQEGRQLQRGKNEGRKRGLA